MTNRFVFAALGLVCSLITFPPRVSLAEDTRPTIDEFLH